MSLVLGLLDYLPLYDISPIHHGLLVERGFLCRELRGCFSIVISVAPVPLMVCPILPGSVLVPYLCLLRVLILSGLLRNLKRGGAEPCVFRSAPVGSDSALIFDGRLDPLFRGHRVLHPVSLGNTLITIHVSAWQTH